MIKSYSLDRLARWAMPICLFLLALAVRLPALGQFLTPDEFLWVDRSRNFLVGLLNSAYVCESPVNHTGFEQAVGLACTLRTGHPGVTTMWSGSLGILLRYLADGSPGSLFDYAVSLSTNPLDPRLIAPERLPTVIFISLWVVLVAWLVGRLLGSGSPPPCRDRGLPLFSQGGRMVGLVVGLLLALDPFHVALSRVIHHDALAAAFMTLSLLMALIYWVRRGSRLWLVMSGVVAGLAFLSKSSSLFLNPFIIVVGVWSLLNCQARGERVSPLAETGDYRWRVVFRLLGDGLLWFACAAAAFFVCWPAMWVIPLDALRTVFTIGIKYASEGHAKGNYFLGIVSNDPGVLFYPVTWLLRSSPLAWLGLLSLVYGAACTGRRGRPSFNAHVCPSGRWERVPSGKAQRRKDTVVLKSWLIRLHLVSRRRSARGPVLWLLLGYVVLFIAFMTFGEKKQDRYILPIYPVITVIAAVGLVELVRLVRHTARRLGLVKKQLPAGVQPSPLRKQGTTADCFSSTSRLKPALRRGDSFFCGRFAPQILLAAVVAFQGVLVVTNYPYYFTYYNPLMGGIRGAESIVTIGWGEGLDLAADYLNQKPNAGQLRVAAWYQSTFAPFFKGEAVSYAKEKGKALSGNYVVFYINQLQRRFPDDEMFRYFEDRYQPETTIDLKGVTYAVIYPGPHIQHFVEDRVEEDRRSYRGIAALLGWDWPGADDPDCPSVIAGQSLPFRLYWEYLGKAPEERFFFRLFGPDGHRVAEGISQPVLSDAERGDPAAWRYGQIITEQGELAVPADTSPGNYRIGIGFYTKAPAVPEGELTFDLPAGENCVRVVRGAE